MDDESDQLPPDLLRDLRQASAPGSDPAALDAAILADAHAAIGRRRRIRRLILAVATVSAAAACFAFVGALWLTPRNFDPNDINRDGRVDIVDAFLLAKRRAAGDTAVSQERIDRLAMLAVALDSSGGGRGTGAMSGGGPR